MEAFSLLKYWRGGGGTSTVDNGANLRSSTTGATTTIVTSVSHQSAETDEDDGDDGPFFDLVFTEPEEDGGGEQAKDEDGDFGSYIYDGDGDGEDGVESDGTEGENEREYQYPSKDLFFKGRLVPIEPSGIVLSGAESNAKSQFSLLKPAKKFRVLMLKFKKSKDNVTEKTESSGSASATPKQKIKREESQQQQQHNQPQRKLFTVKLKVEEVPIVSMFTRDNSSRAYSGLSKTRKQQSSDESTSDEKRSMQRYLKMVRPLYVRVSKRYGEKLRFSRQLSFGSLAGTKAAGISAPSISLPATSMAAMSESEPTEVMQPPAPQPPPASTSTVKSQKQGNLPSGLLVVCKHLGKNRSASAVASVPSCYFQAKSRDDSLLQQQDGIQSAILHCKRSFNASRSISPSP
ncbi:hypothetical protein U1Q18_021194 [Sarracenia purpurea var. burkii]